MTKIQQTLLILIRTLLMLLGGYVALGWLLINPAMVKIMPGSNAMVMNTAFCFILSGVWLTLRPGGILSYRWLTSLLGLFVILLPAFVLIETISGVSLPIDAVFIHKRVLDSNPTPGRMAPNTCMGFILAGLAFLISQSQPTRWIRRGVFTLSFFVFMTGLSSLLAHILDLDWLYSFITYNRMAVPTAIGLMLLGVGIFIIGYNLSDTLHERRQDIYITRIAAVIMIVLALASGMAGFVTLKQGTDQFLQDTMQQREANAVDSITASLDRQVVLKNAVLSFPVFQKNLETLPDQPNDADARDHLDKVAAILDGLNFSAVQLQNTKGEVVYGKGSLVKDTSQSLPVRIHDEDVTVILNDVFYMHAEKPIFKDGILTGKLITEQKLTAYDRIFKQLRSWGNTADAVLCRRVGDTVDCLSSRFIPHPVSVDMFKDGAPAYPISHALLGETGVIYANDIRGIPVLAAYAPVLGDDIGLVVKIETTEFYGFIRDRLHILMGALVLLVVIGIVVLRIQLQPLATRLVQSEQKMRRVNDVLAEDAQRLNRIVEVQNKIALSPFDIATILHNIVDNVHVLTRSSGAVIEMIDGEELEYRAASGLFASSIGLRLNIAGSLSGHCIHSRAVLRCEDTETDARTNKEATRKLNIRSMIVAPLIYEGRVFGVLKTASSEVNAFDLKDEQALQLLSGLIGSALGHQQDYEDKQRLLTERTQALGALEKTTDSLKISEERTRIIIESAYDAFVGMDGSGRITDWNRQAEQIFGWTRAQALGNLFADFAVAASSQTDFTQQLQLLLTPDYQPDKTQRLEINVKRYAGTEFVVEMTIAPLHTGGGVMLAAFLHDITERKNNQEKLAYLAQYDALTGLPNRSLFMDRLSVAVLRVGRMQQAMALMFLDLDGFKKINDDFGHQAGDVMLKTFAQRLSTVVRKTDTVARLAGDEFTIILENMVDPERDVQIVAKKILTAMEQPIDIAGEQVVASTSIGIAITRSSSKNIDELIRHADEEMYKAKKDGKGRYSVRES